MNVQERLAYLQDRAAKREEVRPFEHTAVSGMVTQCQRCHVSYSFLHAQNFSCAVQELINSLYPAPGAPAQHSTTQAYEAGEELIPQTRNEVETRFRRRSVVSGDKMEHPWNYGTPHDASAEARVSPPLCFRHTCTSLGINYMLHVCKYSILILYCAEYCRRCNIWCNIWCNISARTAY